MSAIDTVTKVAPAWDSIHGLRGSDIAERAANVRSNLQVIKTLQEEVESDKEEIAKLLEFSKQDAVQVDDMRVILSKPSAGKTKIDEEKLLKLGVSGSVILAAKVTGPDGKRSVRIFTREESGQ